MNDDELERLLHDALDARARDAVDDDRTPPPPRFASPRADRSVPPSIGEVSGRTGSHRAGRPPSRFSRFALPLSAAAAVVVLAGLVLALVGHGSGSGSGHDQQSGRPVLAGPSGGSPGTRHASTPVAATRPVHISLLNADGSTYGVGMPEIAYFSKRFTDAVGLQRATSVTVNGKVARGAWYFEPSAAGHGPIEGHFRLQHYWPAHSTIVISIAAKGVSAGGDKAFDDSLVSTWSTGAADIATVDDTSHTLTLDVDGRKEGTYPVSLGARNTPTERGIKVIMEKGASICMSGPGYDECGIKYTQRLTYDGEYLHAAPWNTAHIKAGIDSSNGCTNLTLGAARHLYDVMSIGDVVNYPNASGPAMHLGSGYGDWNVAWTQWLMGGLVPTR